jgi:hypothetical protein
MNLRVDNEVFEVIVHFSACITYWISILFQPVYVASFTGVGLFNPERNMA